MTPKEKIGLIKQVFGTEAGRNLLDSFKSETEMFFESDSNHHFYKLGQHVFVRDIDFVLNLPEKEVDDINLINEINDEYDF